MIHIYCGDGKGKTTAAMGLALRAMGRNQNVVICQFLKGSATGEIIELEKNECVRIFRLEKEIPFTFQMTQEDKDFTLRSHNRILDKASHFVQAGYCDLLVLDELCSALETELIDSKKVETFLKDCNCEVVITGRNPSQKLIDFADYITEMKKIKHPFERGIQAREGVEF